MDPPKHPQATSNKQSNGSVSRWVPVSFSVSPSGFGRNEAADKIRRNLNDLILQFFSQLLHTSVLTQVTGHRSCRYISHQRNAGQTSTSCYIHKCKLNIKFIVIFLSMHRSQCACGSTRRQVLNPHMSWQTTPYQPRAQNRFRHPRIYLCIHWTLF